MAHSGSLTISHANNAGCAQNSRNSGRRIFWRRASRPPANCSAARPGNVGRGASGVCSHRKSKSEKQICRLDREARSRAAATSVKRKSSGPAGIPFSEETSERRRLRRSGCGRSRRQQRHAHAETPGQNNPKGNARSRNRSRARGNSLRERTRRKS